MMRPTVILVNTSRGPVLDEPALAEALAERVIAGAGLDVYENEPRAHPLLLKLENVVVGQFGMRWACGAANSGCRPAFQPARTRWKACPQAELPAPQAN